MNKALQNWMEENPRTTAFVKERLPGFLWWGSDRCLEAAGNTSSDFLFALGGRIWSYGSLANVALGDKSMKYITGPSILSGSALFVAAGIHNAGQPGTDDAKIVLGIGTGVAMLALFYGSALVDKIAHTRPVERLLTKVSQIAPKLDSEMFSELANAVVNTSIVWEMGKFLMEGLKTGDLKDFYSAAFLGAGLLGYSIGNHAAAVQNRKMRLGKEHTHTVDADAGAANLSSALGSAKQAGYAPKPVSSRFSRPF